MELTNGKIDRRKHIRLIENIPLSIKMREMPDFKEASSKNISEDGLFLEHVFQDELFPTILQKLNSSVAGEKIDLSIFLPNNNNLKTLSEIVWVKKQDRPFEKKLALGVKFIDLSLEDKNRLTSYISETIKPQRKFFTFEKVVYLSDTNAEGNVYFTCYFDWQGQAREEFYRKHFPLSVWQKGIKLITVNASTEYKHECFLFDEIAIGIEIANLKNMSLELIFSYRNKKTNQIVALGKERIAFADPQGRLIPIPEEIVKSARYFLVDQDSGEKSD